MLTGESWERSWEGAASQSLNAVIQREEKTKFQVNKADSRLSTYFQYTSAVPNWLQDFSNCNII